MFATKIRSTAEALSIVTRPARDAEALRNRLNQVDDGKANEPVTGVLVDLDLDTAAIELIAVCQSHDADLPIVAFGAHVATQLLDAARDAGAQFVMPRGTFTATLPDILERLNQGAV